MYDAWLDRNIEYADPDENETEDDMSEYPQHEKLKNCQGEHSTICSFIEWLEGHKEMGLAEWDGKHYWPIAGNRKIESLIAEFFEIDYEAFMKEKEAMYEEIRGAASRAMAKEAL